MPRSKALLATALVSLFYGEIVFSQEGDDNLPLPVRAYVAAKVYSNLNLYFAHRACVPDLDLESEYKKYLEKAFSAKGRREFDLATMEFVAQFKNKHTQFDDQWLRQKYGQSLGFVVSLVDG